MFFCVNALNNVRLLGAWMIMQRRASSHNSHWNAHIAKGRVRKHLLSALYTVDVRKAKWVKCTVYGGAVGVDRALRCAVDGAAAMQDCVCNDVPVIATPAAVGSAEACCSAVPQSRWS